MRVVIEASPIAHPGTPALRIVVLGLIQKREHDDESSSLSEQSIAARIERLPISSWYVKMRVAIGVATFFDGFDALAIAFVLPVLVGAWNITPPQIGVLISISFVGQALGALFFGWLAERIGRVQTLTICIVVFGVM